MLYRGLLPPNSRFSVLSEEENGRHFLFCLSYHSNGSAPVLSGQTCAEMVNKLVPVNCNHPDDTINIYFYGIKQRNLKIFMYKT